MENTEPEGLYTDYRIETTKQIAALMQSGQIFKLTAPSGVGKSKYLRYLSLSRSVFDKFFKGFLSKIYYVDLNEIYTNKLETLIDILASELETKKQSIDTKIEELLDGDKKVYFIFDHFEQAQNFDEGATRYLRSLRDKFKYKLGYILAIESGLDLDEQKLRYLYNASSAEINLPPLSKKDTSIVLAGLLKENNIKLNDAEKEKIVEYCEGKGGKIRNIVIELTTGKKVEDIINNQKSKRALDYKKFLTKSELIIYEKLIEKKGEVVTRDEIAQIINPQSEGAGVSNEAIDQTVARLRKKLREHRMDKKITTKHGVGFFTE